MTLQYHLRINQGETFQLAIPVVNDQNTPVSLSGMTARGQVRRSVASPAVLHEWTMGNSGVAFDDNSVVLKVPAETSSSWTWRVAAYDVELVDADSNVTRLIEGLVVIHPEVTRISFTSSVDLFDSTFSSTF